MFVCVSVEKPIECNSAEAKDQFLQDFSGLFGYVRSVNMIIVAIELTKVFWLGESEKTSSKAVCCPSRLK